MPLPKSLSPNIYSEIETNWYYAQPYFKKRKSVLFLSDERYWEKHGFVQQSLAYRLAEIGIKVIWIDGSGWRKYQPHSNKNSNLIVQQLPRLPLCRIKIIDNFNVKMSSLLINSYIKKLGNNPIIWIQSGFDERVLETLPYIDVYSVFDDPYKHTPEGYLCSKAALIITQNSFALEIYKKLNYKTIRLFPPMEINGDTFNLNYSISLPEKFPTKIMGYIGSFFPEGFDFELLKECIHSMPDWGFILMGRTNESGMKHIKNLIKFGNFYYEPWKEREYTAAIWKKLKLSLFLYKDLKSQDGAFAVKTLESLRFGIPIVSTKVPKTEDINKFFPSFSVAEELKIKVNDALNTNPNDINKVHEHLSFEMDPRTYLSRVANFFSKGEKIISVAS